MKCSMKVAPKDFISWERAFYLFGSPDRSTGVIKVIFLSGKLACGFLGSLKRLTGVLKIEFISLGNGVIFWRP